MEKPKTAPRSHLFTVRVWEEEVATDRTEWRGKVQLFTSGEVRYFREWKTLMPLLLAMLLQSELEPSTESEQDSSQL